MYLCTHDIRTPILLLLFASLISGRTYAETPRVIHETGLQILFPAEFDVLSRGEGFVASAPALSLTVHLIVTPTGAADFFATKLPSLVPAVEPTAGAPVPIRLAGLDCQATRGQTWEAYHCASQPKALVLLVLGASQASSSLVARLAAGLFPLPRSVEEATSAPALRWQPMALPTGAARPKGLAKINGQLALVMESGVFTSRDEGLTWQSRALPPRLIKPLGIVSHKGRFFVLGSDGDMAAMSDGDAEFELLARFNPNPPAIKLMSGGDALWLDCKDQLFRSEDGGVSWQSVPVGWGKAVVTAVEVDGATWFVATSAGLWTSPAGGATWTRILTGNVGALRNTPHGLLVGLRKGAALYRSGQAVPLFAGEQALFWGKLDGMLVGATSPHPLSGWHHMILVRPTGVTPLRIAHGVSFLLGSYERILTEPKGIYWVTSGEVRKLSLPEGWPDHPGDFWRFPKAGLQMWIPADFKVSQGDPGELRTISDLRKLTIVWTSATQGPERFAAEAEALARRTFGPMFEIKETVQEVPGGAMKVLVQRGSHRSGLDGMQPWAIGRFQGRAEQSLLALVHSMDASVQTPDTSVLFAIAASAQPLPVNASVREPRRR